MTANEPNRATYRAVLAAGLEAKIVTSLGHAQAVYAYQKADFDKQSPVIVVTGAATETEQQGFGEDVPRFDYDVLTFVIYADGTAWTEAHSEDRLDLLEKEVRDWIIDNRSGTVSWRERGATEVDAVSIGGDEYRMERIPVSALIL